MTAHNACAPCSAPVSAKGLGRGLSLSLPLRVWMALSRNRNALAKLEPHLLADIGLTPEMARTEASRPFWDVPVHWHR